MALRGDHFAALVLQRVMPHVLRRVSALHAPSRCKWHDAPLDVWRTGARFSVGDAGLTHLQLHDQHLMVSGHMRDAVARGCGSLLWCLALQVTLAGPEPSYLWSRVVTCIAQAVRDAGDTPVAYETTVLCSNSSCDSTSAPTLPSMDTPRTEECAACGTPADSALVTAACRDGVTRPL